VKSSGLIQGNQHLLVRGLSQANVLCLYPQYSFPTSADSNIQTTPIASSLLQGYIFFNGNDNGLYLLQDFNTGTKTWTKLATVDDLSSYVLSSALTNQITTRSVSVKTDVLGHPDTQINCGEIFLSDTGNQLQTLIYPYKSVNQNNASGYSTQI
jgi:hypothetical protein